MAFSQNGSHVVPTWGATPGYDERGLWPSMGNRPSRVALQMADRFHMTLWTALQNTEIPFNAGARDGRL